MKKAALVLIAIAFVSGAAFAQGDTTATPAKATPPANAIVNETKATIGKIANVTLAEPAKGIANGTVTVVDDTGKAADFTITQSTKILGTTLDAITLNQLKIGDKIKIKSKEGSQEASAIKVVE